MALELLPAANAANEVIPGDFVTLDPNEVEIGDRLREIDEAWAWAIGLSMKADGQIHPIHVAHKPGGGWMLAGPGAHRLSGARKVEIAIDAKVVTSDTLGQRRREAAENVFRRKNDPLERAASIAELVRLHKIARGIDPAKDGRAVSIQTRWQKAVEDEAADTNDTMSFVYGWSEDIAKQIGVNKRTIERDLLLYRRLAPSLTARLRAQRHPIISNAGQLGALAKLEPNEQAGVVDQLLDPLAPAKTVADAQARLNPKSEPITPDKKRFNAIIGTLQRMSVTERTGLFQSPQFHDVIPVEARRLLAPMLLGAGVIGDTHEPDDEATYAGGGKAGLGGTGGAVLDGGLEPDGERHLRSKEGTSALSHDPALAGRSGVSAADADEVAGAGADEDAPELGISIDFNASVLGRWLLQGKPFEEIVAAIEAVGGRYRFTNGTYEIKLAKVTATCTAGGLNLVQAWINAAKRKQAQAKALGLTAVTGGKA